MTTADRFDLAGKVALVTGGSRGLGRSMVLGFAEAGADVIIASRKLESCLELAEEVERTTGRAALPYGVHVGHWDELPGLVDAAYERFGKVDVLVNNAGMSPLYPSVTDVTEQMFDSVVNLNLKGPFRLCALIGPRMAESGGGSIINVSTTGSIRPYPGVVPYAAAKAGLNSMSEGLTRAFGPTVRVNVIMPGPFRTDIAKAWDMESTLEGVKSHALQRIGEPDEVVGTALYLASDASSFTTGAIIRVDGGIP
jgi:NAD(P)-dependent dehydrogenase (short-subunit alcohol dehydrogenase family)